MNTFENTLRNNRNLTLISCPVGYLGWGGQMLLEGRANHPARGLPMLGSISLGEQQLPASGLGGIVRNNCTQEV